MRNGSLGISDRLFAIFFVTALAMYLSATVLQPMSIFGATPPDRAALSLCKSLAVLILAAWSYRHAQNPIVILSISLACILCAVVLQVVSPSGSVIIIASGLSGVSSGLLLMMLATLQCTCADTHRREAIIILSFFLSSFVAPVFALLSFNEEMTQFICYGGALILAFLSFLLRSKREDVSLIVCNSIKKYRSRFKFATLLQSVFRFEVLLAAAGAWILSFSFGVFESATDFYSIDLLKSNIILIYGIFAVILIYLLSVTLHKRIPVSAFLTTVSVVFLIAYIGVMMFSDINTSLYSLMLIGLYTYYLAVWLFMTKEAVEQTLPAAFVFGLLATGPIAIVRMAGKMIPAVFELVTGNRLSPEQLTFVVLVAFVLTLLALILVYARSEANSTESGADLNPYLRVTIDDGQHILETVCDRFGLSEQEKNVLIPYSTGRSSLHIAESLGLSQYTVKEYIRRAYKKLDVHNKQELIDLMERSKKENSQQEIGC